MIVGEKSAQSALVKSTKLVAALRKQVAAAIFMHNDHLCRRAESR